MKISLPKALVFIFVLLITYTYGLVTVQYKFFPYYEIRSFKRSVLSEVTVNASNTNHKSKKNDKGEFIDTSKKSFIEEHTRKVDVVMVGDSIIDSAEWEDLFPTVNIGDQGIAGDTTWGVLNRIDLITKSNPSKVFIMVGINDIGRGESVDIIFSNYSKIINELLKSNINVYLQSTLLVGKDHYADNDKVLGLNKMLEEYANTRDRITYINLNDRLTDGSFLKEEYSNDSLHLNGKGYKIWKETIAPYVL